MPTDRKAIDAAVATNNERVKKILSAPEAKHRETLAQHLAFDTTMTVQEAVATLSASNKLSAETCEISFNTPMTRAQIERSWEDVANTINARMQVNDLPNNKPERS